MTHRSGVTLVEVLVAIFITAIGLMALLTLFPLGALSMAQAVKDDRCALIAQNATMIARIGDLRNDLVIRDYYSNPAAREPSLSLQYPQLTDLSGRSYPVFIDPVGYYAYSATLGWGNQVGGSDQDVPTNRAYAHRLPRVSPSFISTIPTPLVRQQVTLRWFSMLDDMTFDINGVPYAPTSVPVIEREERYSFALLCQLPRLSAPSLAELTVVVYSGRSLQFSSSLQPVDERPFAATFNVEENTVTLRWNPNGGEAPVVRKGTWILDSTVVPPDATANPPRPPDPHAYFYRVVNVTEGSDASGPFMLVEVQQSLDNKGFGKRGDDPPVLAAPGTVIVMERVVEVYEKKTQW